MYQHHIMLKTMEPIENDLQLRWYKTVKEFAPENVLYTYYEGDLAVAMEYGVREDDEFPHCYVIPLTRDLTQEETLFVVDAWEYIYDRDFDIEISNMYDVDTTYDMHIDPTVKESAINDMAKWHHNRWLHQMMKEGWHYGLYYSETNKSHPALREWDTLAESHRRIPEFTNEEVARWLRLYNKI